MNPARTFEDVIKFDGAADWVGAGNWRHRPTAQDCLQSLGFVRRTSAGADTRRWTVPRADVCCAPELEVRWRRDASAGRRLGEEPRPTTVPTAGEWLLLFRFVGHHPPGIARRLRSPKDLLARHLLHHTNYPENWRVWLNAAGVAQGLLLGPCYDLGNNLIVAACADTGVAIIQPCLVERELASGELVQPFDLVVATGRSYGLCQRKSASGGRAIEAFVRWISSQAGVAEL